LGLVLPSNMPRGELEASVRQRLDFVRNLDRGALIDLASWACVPIDSESSNQTLVGWIVAAPPRRFNGLSDRGLRLFAELRCVPLPDNVTRDDIERLLRQPKGFWEAVRRRRRKIMGSILGRAFEPAISPEFAPEGTTRPAREPTLKKRIESHGVVSGLATTLRGVADDYVARKLDDIERRVDAKLDEIDRRLAEWRDREVSNRLRILKITLVFSILVALISLGYDYIRAKPDAKRGDSGEVHRVVDEGRGDDARPAPPEAE
jgi:hypothetical protein